MSKHFKAELFKVLSHPTRIRILDALREGQLTVGDLQQRLSAEQSTVSQHLAALRAKDLVQARREGTSVWYTVADPAIWQLLEIARDIYERQLTSSRAMLEALQ
ncbi:MAG TPA: metalloregulator ArsR/SmtB family transcription factor [Candidatus Dormibacteraeota bacterium]|nr:metalloregulator ArsR/SmtB family transcription factor [Candidatus Dormibacteraeota bacterium]